MESPRISNRPPALAIIGGGLAGLAAALRASEQGLQVELFEQSDRLGGRAGSFTEHWNGNLIDHCQHVAMGCCANFLDFCRRVGAEDCFTRHKTLHFIGPDGTQSDFAPLHWLPAPLNLLPRILRLKFLTLTERWSIIRTLRNLLRLRMSQETNSETIGAWLRRQGQSERIIVLFWSTVLISALSETVDYASLNTAKQVFLDGFCTSRQAHELILPQAPLGEILDRRVGARLQQRGVLVHRSARVMEIAELGPAGVAVHLSEGVKNFPAAILAVPWFDVPNLFCSSQDNFLSELEFLKHMPTAAITAVHLWCDRPLTMLPHAALAGRLSQWIFNETVLMREHSHDNLEHDARRDNTPNKESYYYQVVISASHRLVKQNKEELLKVVLGELESVFPDARQAKLLHSRVVTMPRAVFSPKPGIDQLRPPQHTSMPNLFFAGDWTATGWPATMEGAVRSGYLAVEELLKTIGHKAATGGRAINQTV